MVYKNDPWSLIEYLLQFIKFFNPSTPDQENFISSPVGEQKDQSSVSRGNTQAGSKAPLSKSLQGSTQAQPKGQNETKVRCFAFRMCFAAVG